MTKEELQKIKEHIEMRARIESYATEIRQILWKAVEELETKKELQEKLVTIEKDDIRKAELQKRETLAEKLEYLKQVETYAIFNDDTKIMFWTSCMKSEIIQELQNGNFALTVNKIIENKNKQITALEEQIAKMKADVKGNLKFAEHNNNKIMRQKMCSMLLQWKAKYKE